MTTATAPAPAPIPYAAPGARRRGPRINFRMLVFLLAVATPPMWVIYSVIDATVYGGIKDRGTYKEVELKALGYYDFDGQHGTINDVPEKWRALDGQRVQLTGFMWAGTSAGYAVRDFQFVYNITKCCFNGPPLVQERVFAHVPDKYPPAPYYGDFVTLTGILHVKIENPTGDKVNSVYTIDVEKIGPA
jgi:hypothetical protein